MSKALPAANGPPSANWRSACRLRRTAPWRWSRAARKPALVERRSSATDARQVEVHLTKKGDRCVGQLAALHQSELSAFKRAFHLPDFEA